MEERWKLIRQFPRYSVSDQGRIRNNKTGRIMAQSLNQQGVVCVGLMDDGVQFHRSVPKLVARAFIPHPRGPFDTPINLDGDRMNNHVDNLVWRPRWFAVLYNQQFKEPYANRIDTPIQEITTKPIKETFDNSFTCAIRNGLLEKDVVLSILNRTYAWPTYQQFRVME